MNDLLVGVGIVMVSGGLIVFIRWSWKAAKAQFIHDLIDRLSEAFDLVAMRSDLEAIKDEVTYNEGKSLKDGLRRVEQSLEELHVAHRLAREDE